MSKKSTSRAPPLQCSETAAPVQAQQPHLFVIERCQARMRPSGGGLERIDQRTPLLK